jgi:chromosome segregation ATPase
MSNFAELARAIRAKVERDRLSLQLADAFDEIGTVEQAAAEANTRLVNTRSELTAAEKDLADVRARAQEVRAEIEASRVQLAADVARVMQEATQAATELRLDAGADALAVRRAADDYVAEQRAHGDGLAASNAALEAEIVELTAKRDGLEAQINAIREKLG